MANQALYDSATYQVPERILATIRQALPSAPAGTKGRDRALGIINDPHLSYSAVKALKADLEAPSAETEPGFELAGGRAMLAWVNQSLTQDRQDVVRRQTTRANAGQDNQFIRSHEKNGFAAPVSAKAEPGQEKVRRQALFEDDIPVPNASWYMLAVQLVKLFPELVFTKDSDTHSVTITTDSLQLTVRLK